MPIYNNVFRQNTPEGPVLSPQVLQKFGPVVPVEVGVPNSLAQVYSKEGKTIPSPKSGWGLIDTGATRTCVDDGVIRSLGVNPIDRTTINGSNGPHEVNVFPALLRFPAIANFQIEFSAALGVNIRAQEVKDQPIIALLGRDILSKCVLIYNGTLGTFTLSLM
ncbi:MAG: hypothetical protein A2172_01635 [Candidatus Woykebacteria bacterium RBG_13_40_15]|uniref:Peptidase A2 domain-containing protein n=1 Tax=Candidatus Woykebacteria bacterium RBG_13_40_15 TaxID=1802593 RepID=A0A1G1W548_9BACT|nr:MAG: hypothetical protein A2172_01635 [Candidatus Woykebacteria bacterium RBG_13_40_15]